MAAIREVSAKSILSKSGISDYSVNCYTGCIHACIYCYARYMKVFSNHEEPWGQFVDVKINSPEILANEVKRRKPGRVFVSSVCDAYQLLEKRYELTRRCLKILVDAGFYPAILTKSKLVTRDLDILEGHDNCEVGCTLTTMNEQLRFRIEPGASPTRERIAALEEASSQGIKISTFLGPFMPGLSDSEEALDALVSSIAHLPFTRIFADKLNLKPGLWNVMLPFLRRYHPELIEMYRKLFFDKDAYHTYCSDLGQRLRTIAEAHGIKDRLNPIF